MINYHWFIFGFFMAGSFKGLTQKQIDKRLKEGRGQGLGASYKPFIYTYEVSSLGRSHRLFGKTSQRMHHLLSDLELAVFLTLDWLPQVTDIREQFPLRPLDTVELALDAGISHAKFKGVNQVLSSDFVVDTLDPNFSQFAIQAKYTEHLKLPQTIERLELERRYWASKKIPWYLITEKQISKIVFNNIQWLYPAQKEELANEDLQHYYTLFCHEFEKAPEKSIIKIAQSLDMAYDLESGLSLYWLRNLLARRFFVFDINQPYRGLTPSVLAYNQHQEDEVHNVSA